MDYKEQIAKLLKDATGLEEEQLYALIEIPPDTKMGDYAFPCFSLAKTLKKAPAAIAKELADTVSAADFTASPLGPYLNFFLDKQALAKTVVSEVMATNENYGASNIGKGKTVVIDYSSPNIAKPFHVGHLRSTVIGGALYNIYKHLGYNCVGINHLGDWGTQFGKLIVAYKKWGDKQTVEEGGIQRLTELYVKFHDEAEKDDSLNDEARSWFVKMQDGEEEAMALWKWIYDISLTEFKRVYKILGVEFDYYTGESFYNDKMEPVIKELKEKNLLKESGGAMIVDLEDCSMPPCLILRKDGGTLYATRDITAALYRKKTYNFSKCLYLTALDQNLHFAQFFKVIEKMGYDFFGELIHVPFGLVSLETGKLSTRKGQVILMEELLKEAVQKTFDIINERNPELANKEQTAEMVGISAVIFNELYNGRIKDVVFSWDKILNFYGETGPYVQYTHTRAASVINKANDENILINENIDFSCLTDDNSIAILKNIYGVKEKLLEAAAKNEPSIVSRQLVALCQSFNKFYNEDPILKAEENIRDARLLLTKCVRDVVKTLLLVLGMKAPEKM